VGAIFYFAACLIVAFFGSRRVLGFLGTLILGILLTPIAAAIILLLGTSRPGRAKVPAG